MSKKYILDNIQEIRVCRMYTDENLSTDEIAKIFNVSRSSIFRTLLRNNVKSRGYKIKITPEQEQQICDIYKEGMTPIKIGEKFNVSCSPIFRILKNNNINIRNNSEAQKINLKKEIIQELIKIYHNGYSPDEISKKLNISVALIKRILKENNIKLRSLSQKTEITLSNMSEAQKIKIPKKTIEEIIEEYVNEEHTPSKIGEKFDISGSVILRILKENNIHIRTLSEAMKIEETKKKLSESHIGLLSKENHPNWNGGTTHLPYCEKWTPELREAVRLRDSHICQLCGCTQEQNTKRKQKLTVHHVHYLKSDCYPDLITLCMKCNNKVNYNRDNWEQYFMNELGERRLLYWTINMENYGKL